MIKAMIQDDLFKQGYVDAKHSPWPLVSEPGPMPVGQVEIREVPDRPPYEERKRNSTRPIRHNKNSLLVKVFMLSFGQEVKAKPAFPERKILWMRVRLIWEEFRELLVAVWRRDMVATADALTDLLVVVYGMAHALGVPIDECFRSVMNSNMSKLNHEGKPIYRNDGKILKSQNYTPPDLRKVMGL
jgi:NTP pyrophosphatase (non-canonical NTP hydrolase)